MTGLCKCLGKRQTQDPFFFTTVTVKIPFLWKMTPCDLVQWPIGTNILEHLVAFLLRSPRRVQEELWARAIPQTEAVSFPETLGTTYTVRSISFATDFF